MTSQNEPHPLLVRQATRLEELGIPAEVGKRTNQRYQSLEAYVASLPLPCEQCLAEAEVTKNGVRENRLSYFLVEPRAGLVMPCEAAKIVYQGGDRDFYSREKKEETPSKPYWTLLNNGWGKVASGRSKIPIGYDASYERMPGFFSARAMDAVFGYAHRPEVVAELVDNPMGYTMDLQGSLRRADKGDSAAYLSLFKDEVRLGWWCNDIFFPRHTVAYRRECSHRDP